MFLKCKIAFKGYWLPNTWIKMMSLIPTNLWYDFFSGMSSHVINFSWCYCLILEKKLYLEIMLLLLITNWMFTIRQHVSDMTKPCMPFLVLRALESGFFLVFVFFVKTCVYRVTVDWYFIHCIASISLFNDQDRRWRLDFIMYTYLNNVNDSMKVVK